MILKIYTFNIKTDFYLSSLWL